MRLLTASLALGLAALSSGCILVPVDDGYPRHRHGYGYGYGPPPPSVSYHYDNDDRRGRDDHRWHHRDDD